MRPRDRAPGWEVGEGGQSRVRRLTAHLRLCPAAALPLLCLCGPFWGSPWGWRESFVRLGARGGGPRVPGTAVAVREDAGRVSTAGQAGSGLSEGASRGREDSLCHHCSKRPEGGAQAPLLEPGQVSAWSGRTPGSWSRPVSPLPPALRPQFPTRRQCRGGRRPVSLEGGEAPRVQIGPPLAPWLGTGVKARALLLGPVRWPEDRCSGCRVRQ